MGWLLWMFFVWFMISRIPDAVAVGRLGVGSGVWWLAVQSPHGPRRVMVPCAAMKLAPPRELSAHERREGSMAELRRRYVADEISVEEYESELDRVLRDS